MSDELFRKKAVSNPEQLNDYIKVAGPGVWLVICAVIVFLAAACVWSIFGVIDISVETKGYSDGENIYCYLSDDDIQTIKEGMDVYIGQEKGTVDFVSEIPDNYSSITEKLGGEEFVRALRISENEWRYFVNIKFPDADKGIVDISIVTDRISPVMYILN